MKTTKGPLTVDKVEANQFKPELAQAQVRQVVTTSYPTRNVSGSIFDEEEFGLESRDYDETRVAWTPVPLNSTVEQVVERLAKYPDACIQKHLSYKPIITKQDEDAIAAGLTTKERLADAQIVRYGEGENAGQPILHNGNIQYKRNFFRLAYADDIDEREVEITSAETEGRREITQPQVVASTVKV